MSADAARASLTAEANVQHARIDAALDRISPRKPLPHCDQCGRLHEDGCHGDPQERLEDAQYDLALAKRAASGRSLEEIEKDLEAARAKEQAAIRGRAYDEIPVAQVARFDLQKERTKALAVKACEAELEEAMKAEGVIL